MASLYKGQLQPESSDVRIGRRAMTQHGVFARAHAMECGLTDAMIRTRVAAGRWERLHPGVYRLTGSQPTWRQRLLAVCFAWGPGACASHRSAAILRRLAGFAGNAIELIVPRDRRRCGPPGIVHRPRSLPAVDVEIVDAIPVTTVARTLLDVAGLVPRDVLEEALDDALQRGLVSLPRLRWRLEDVGGRGTPGTAQLRELVEAGSAHGVPKSVFETRLLRVLRDNGLPEPERQYEIRNVGRVVARVDFAYPDARLAIEADSYRWHAGRRAFERDLARRNAITALHWRLFHATWRDLADPRRIIGEVTAALGLSPS